MLGQHRRIPDELLLRPIVPKLLDDFESGLPLEE